MQKFSRLMTTAGLAALIGAAQPVWAESAPVFDVDNVDQGAEQSQDLPMPPPPGEEGGAKTHQVAPSAQADQQSQQGGSTFMPVDAGSTETAAQSQGQTQSPPQSQSVAATPEAPRPAESAGAKATTAKAAQPAAGVSVSNDNLSPEQRMRRLEQQLNSLQNTENPAQVESLQSEVQSLRSQVEQLNHQLDSVQKQQKALPAKPVTKATANNNDDNDTETAPDDQPAPVKKKVTKAAAADQTDKSVAAEDVTKNQPDVAEEQKAYQTAYDLIKAKKYPEAVSTLQAMLKKYPSGQFASNAHYWLGELYGLMNKNDQALTEFSTVIEKFPGSPRVSDAYLKVGLILAAQAKWPEAKKTFNRVINTYPGTASSRLASEQLKQIKLAGH